MMELFIIITGVIAMIGATALTIASMFVNTSFSDVVRGFKKKL